MRYYYPNAGENISVSIDNAVAMANGLFDPVSFTFNGVEIIVDYNSGNNETYMKYREGLNIQKGLLPSELFEI